MKPLIPVLPAVVLLVACSADTGPELGDFPAISKKETDAPFTLAAPSSRSPAAFTFTSSNAAVATISGAQVTIRGPGQSTITAAQERIGGYGPTSKATTLTVEAVPCGTGQVRVNGACTAVPTCVPPATLVGNQCIAPATTAATVTTATLRWMGTTRTDTWANAHAFCDGSVIDGVTGWRLPAPAELSALVTSGALAGRGWVLGNTWSSTMGSTLQATSHVAVHLGTGETMERADTAGAYVSCVR